jgi:hypothetical protein
LVLRTARPQFIHFGTSYIAGGDNAANVSGYSVRPGTDQSRFGFKLKWDAMHNGDTFIDAVCAYRYP